MSKIIIPGFLVLAFFVSATPLLAQQRPEDPAAMGPVDTPDFHTSFVRLGPETDGLLYRPAVLKSHTALVVAPQNDSAFEVPWGREMARRGFLILLVSVHSYDMAPDAMPEAWLPPISRGIRYLRGLQDVNKVVVLGHSGNAETTLLYDNVAEHGPAACQGPEKLYPCDGRGLTGLSKPDGLVILDAPLGAFHRMSGIDAAFGHPRDGALDMFASGNGYDRATGKANYTPAFVKRYYAAQAARYARVVADAQARLKAIVQGKSSFGDDEPFVVRGVAPSVEGARLFEPDTGLAARTRKPHLLIKKDGSEAKTIITSVRPPGGQDTAKNLTKLRGMTLNTTVRHFLASYAIRTAADYAITEDGITGVDWHSAYASPPGNAEGVTVPTLVLAASCHYLIVPDEIIYDHLAAKDKSYAVVEGGDHYFRPCRPEFGASSLRALDFVASWLSKTGRFN